MINFSNEFIIKNKELVRMEMNLIQLPLFSKSSRRKVDEPVTYYFNKNKATYVKVIPKDGDYIPGESEEKIFFVLMLLMKHKGMERTFTVQPTDFKDILNLSSKNYNLIIRKSLERLASTKYIFRNTFYSNTLKGVIENEISTNLLTFKSISTESLKEGDKRVKENYEITISEYIYNNVFQKGYMVYNINTLLEIESNISKKIYMIIEQLRFENEFLKIPSTYLLDRIPVKYDSSHISQSIKTLTKSLEDLMEKKLIEEFKFIKNKTWKNSEIEIHFSERIQVEKQKRFFQDRNDFNNFLNFLSRSADKEINPILQSDISITDEMIKEVLSHMPEKSKNIPNILKIIETSILKYGFFKVLNTASYMKKNKVDRVQGYFENALKNGWAKKHKAKRVLPKKIEKPLEIPPINNQAPMEIVQVEKKPNPPEPPKNPWIDFSSDDALYYAFKGADPDFQQSILALIRPPEIKNSSKDNLSLAIKRLNFKRDEKTLICNFLKKYPHTFTKYHEKMKITPAKVYMKPVAKVINILLSGSSKFQNFPKEIKKAVSSTMVELIVGALFCNKLTFYVLKGIIFSCIN